MFRLSVFAFSQLQRESHSIVAVLRFEQLHSQSRAQSLLRYTQALGTRLRAFPDLHAGGFLAILVCIPSREVVFLGKIRKLATFGVYCAFVFRDKVSFEACSFLLTYWKQHSVSVCLFNIYFCHRRIHFRFRCLASIVVQYLCQAFFVIPELLLFIAGLVLWNSKRKCDWRHRGRNLIISHCE